MSVISNILDAILSFTTWMWTFPLLIVLIGGGIAIMVACDFIQIKHFGLAMRKCLGGARTSDSGGGKVSGWSAMIAALANTIGTGNIVGVGSAIAIGGPGAVFWMWVVGFIAMGLKFSEATLGVATRVRDKDGNWKGGAYVYLSKVWKPLGIIWGLFASITFPIACGVHTGAIVDAAATLSIPNLATTIVFTIIVIIIILGGMGVLIKVTDKMVPIMAGIYIVAGLLIIALNIQNFIPTIVSIFTNALTGTAATGGFTGATLAVVIQNGCARGVYSNDGGNGSASLMHSRADTTEPVEQGLYGIFEATASTMVVCSFTALVVLCTGAWTSGDPGSVLAINAFGSIGIVGHVIAAISLILFAASSALSIATSAGFVARDIFGKVIQRIIQALVVVGCFIGGTIGVDAALPWIDVCNMFLILCNVGGTMFLLGTLRKLTQDYFKSGKDKLV